jgi:hypothetical protein
MGHVTIEQFMAMLLSRPLDETVQNHIFAGNPFAFRTSPSALTVLTNHLIKRLNVQPTSICVVGSGKIGFSLNPDNFPRPFSESSDIDVAVIDQLMFDTVRSGPIPLNSRPRFLSGVSADVHAASLPVGSITA